MRVASILPVVLALAAFAPLAGAQAVIHDHDASHADAACPSPDGNMVFMDRHMHSFGKVDRPVIGLSTHSGSIRDTIGVLVISISPNGPADKAGIEEGDRIATVNSVDLRVQAQDASDHEMHGLMANRLARTIQKGKAGDAVDLRVYHNGQYHTVKVTTVKASELASDDDGSAEFGDLALPGMPRMLQLRTNLEGMGSEIRRMAPQMIADDRIYKL